MVTYTKHALKIFCLLVLLPVIVHTQVKVSAAVEHQIDSIFRSYENIPGCAIAVIKNGKTLLQKGYGLANLEYVAKQITAACVFLLEKEGKLNLDDPIQKFLPEFPQYEEGKLAIHHLTYQTSGIRSYLAILYSQNKYFGDQIDNEEAFKLIKKQRNLNYGPGTRQDLSNSNYVLLAEIIRKVSGKSLADYAQEKLFDPLEMNNSIFLENPNTLITNRAIAYQGSEEGFSINHFFNPSVVGDGGFYCTLEDAIKWSKNLSSGMVGGKNLITEMITPGTLSSGSQTMYGGGLFRQNHYDIQGLPTVRHSGQWAGFQSLYYQFLNEDTSFIILSNNSNTNVWGLLDQLTPFFLGDEIARAQNAITSTDTSNSLQEIELSEKEKQEFAGDFYDVINGNLRNIRLENGRLLYRPQPDRPGSPLLVVAPKELVFEAAPFIRLTYGKYFNDMALTINDQQPTHFKRYQNQTYKEGELMAYEKSFYNKDLDVVYQVKSVENQLQILINGEELVALSPFSKDMFRDEHFGYITFHRDSTGKIKSFSRTDNTFENLVFHVLNG